MRNVIAAVACIGMIGACKDAAPRAEAPQGAAGSAQPAAAPPAADETKGSADQVAAEMQAAMKAFLDYTESVFAIIREHGQDCDLAAKQLESRAAVFSELGPRLMKVREAIQALPAADRERINRESLAAMEAFKARSPDVDALDQRAKACEKSSAAFAAVAPKVMFVQKR